MQSMKSCRSNDEAKKQNLDYPSGHHMTQDLNKFLSMRSNNANLRSPKT